MEHHFVVADGLSDDALNSLINASQAQVTQYRAAIARCEQIAAQARLKLLAKEIAEAEQE